MPTKQGEWEKKLSEALTQWLNAKSSRYQFYLHFANALKIKPNIFWKIRFARHVANDIEIYAKIFYITDLPEADPRTVPPDRNGKERKWSEEEWSKWVSQIHERHPLWMEKYLADQSYQDDKKITKPSKQDKKNEARLKTEIEKPNPQTTVTSDHIIGTPGMMIGGFVDKLMATLIQQVITNPQVIHIITEIVRKEDAKRKEDIGKMIETLLVILTDIAGGDEKRQEELQQKYGSSLSRLASLMGILSDPQRTRREQKIRMQKLL